MALNPIAVQAALYATAATEEELQRGDQAFKRGASLNAILQATNSSPECRSAGLATYFRHENDDTLNEHAVELALRIATSTKEDYDAAHEVFEDGGTLADVLWRANCPSPDSYLLAQEVYFAVSDNTSTGARSGNWKERLARLGGIFHPRQFAPAQHA